MDTPSTSRDFPAPKRPRNDDSDSDEEEQLSEIETSDCSDTASDSDVETVVGDFTWRNVENFAPSTFEFDNTRSGISPFFDVRDDSEECDYFLKFFDEELMQHIADETNKYYNYCESTGSKKSKKWINTTVGELYTFFALVMLMPHVNKHSIKD